MCPLDKVVPTQLRRYQEKQSSKCTRALLDSAAVGRVALVNQTNHCT